MLNTNSRLTSSQVTAIASLVSGAVEGLTREQVTITDQDGTVLTAPGATNGAPADDLERTRELEANIAGDVLAIVEAVAGPGNARVAVNATVDWSATSKYLRSSAQCLTTTENNSAPLRQLSSNQTIRQPQKASLELATSTPSEWQAPYEPMLTPTS